MRHSLVSDKKRLESCVEKYNKLCNALEDDFHETTVESILDGDFPWSLLTGMNKCDCGCCACTISRYVYVCVRAILASDCVD